jgi:putative hydrolase
MKYRVDCHCHSVSSGHGYSTVLELADFAKKKGIRMIAVTDHGPALPGAPHPFHFSNLKVVPEKIYGVEVLSGIEANIIDYNGAVDLDEKRLSALDIVLAGYHEPCLEPATGNEHTRAVLRLMETGTIDVLVHPGNPRFPIEIDKVLKKARETNTLVEINNSSLWISREGSLKNCLHIARQCKKYGVRVIAGSDAHICFDVGNFHQVDAIFQKIEMPAELVMNRSVEAMKEFLKSKGKRRFAES